MSAGCYGKPSLLLQFYLLLAIGVPSERDEEIREIVCEISITSQIGGVR